MDKKFLKIAAMLLLPLIMSGCAAKKGDQPAAEIRENDFSEAAMMRNRFEEASREDLKPGTRASVTGQKNADGSIEAEMIMLGEMPEDFREMSRPPQDSESRERPDFPEGSERPDFPEGGMNPGRFRDLSQEERSRFIQERMASGEFVPGNSPRTAGGASGTAARIAGEILEVDDSSLTLKLEEGGSGMVFFSEGTALRKPKE